MDKMRTASLIAGKTFGTRIGAAVLTGFLLVESALGAGCSQPRAEAADTGVPPIIEPRGTDAVRKHFKEGEGFALLQRAWDTNESEDVRVEAAFAALETYRNRKIWRGVEEMMADEKLPLTVRVAAGTEYVDHYFSLRALDPVMETADNVKAPDEVREYAMETAGKLAKK